MVVTYNSPVMLKHIHGTGEVRLGQGGVRASPAKAAWLFLRSHTSEREVAGHSLQCQAESLFAGSG